MERVTSAQNQYVKLFRQLAVQAKARRELRQTVFEGVHVCDAYLKAGNEPVYCVASDSALELPEVTAIIARLDDSTPVINVPDSLFHSISIVEQGVGILFIVDVPANGEAPALTGDALLIDAVQDPGNLGALLRTAVASGVKTAYISEGSASAWAPKTIRAGMGAQVVMDIYEQVNLTKLVESARVMVRATSLQAKESLYEKDLTIPTAWIVGNEGAGVSAELLELCGDNTVMIPQDDSVESLNVAAATAICLFEQRRQRG